MTNFCEDGLFILKNLLLVLKCCIRKLKIIPVREVAQISILHKLYFGAVEFIFVLEKLGENLLERELRDAN